MKNIKTKNKRKKHLLNRRRTDEEFHRLIEASNPAEKEKAWERLSKKLEEQKTGNF